MTKVPAGIGLEIGCGGGDLALALAETYVCDRIDAFDVAAGAIEVARGKAAAKSIDNVNFYVADGNSLTLPAGRYDFICASHALHHVEIGIIHNFDSDDEQDNALLDLVFLADHLAAQANLVEPCLPASSAAKRASGRSPRRGTCAPSGTPTASVAYRIGQ